MNYCLFKITLTGVNIVSIPCPMFSSNASAQMLSRIGTVFVRRFIRLLSINEWYVLSDSSSDSELDEHESTGRNVLKLITTKNEKKTLKLYFTIINTTFTH